jgi:hypothetical protein
MDMDDGYILWTGIWKALGNHKGEWGGFRAQCDRHNCFLPFSYHATLLARTADIVKMLESQPELATQLRRVRGGYLKIQGQYFLLF